MTRSSPDSVRPRSERNALASAASSCEISSSILVQRATARVDAFAGNAVRPAFSAARAMSSPTSATSFSSRLITRSSGLAERNWKRRAVLERVLASLHKVALPFELRGFTPLEILLDAFEPALRDAKVRENQL